MLHEEDDSQDGEKNEISMDEISDEKIEYDENGFPTMGATIIDAEPFSPSLSQNTKRQPIKLVSPTPNLHEANASDGDKIFKTDDVPLRTISQSLGFSKSETKKEVALGCVNISFYDDSVVKTIVEHGTQESKDALVEELKSEIRRRADESLEDITNKYIEDIKSR